MTHTPPPPAQDPAASGEPFQGDSASASDRAGEARGHETRGPAWPDAQLDAPTPQPDGLGGDEPGAESEPADAAATATPESGAPRRRRGRRGGAGRRGRANRPAGAETAGDASGDDDREGQPESPEVGAASTEFAPGNPSDEQGEPQRKKRRRRGKRGKRAADDGAASFGDASAADGAPDAPDAADGEHEPGHDDGDGAAEGHADEREHDSGAGAPAGGKKRSRRSRRKRGGRSGGAETAQSDGDGRAPAEDDAARDGQAAPRNAKRKKRGRRGGRRRDGDEREPEPARDEAEPVGIEIIPGEEDDLAELEPVARARTRRGKASIDPDAPTHVDVVRDQRILVNAADAEETRVVVVEGQRIVDLQMTVRDHESYVNDIYRGRVVNLETAIGAAFVDFGQGRNGFLHVSDVMEVYGDDKWSLDKLLTARTAPEEWGEGGKADEIEGEEKTAPKRHKGKTSRSRPRKRRGIGELLQKGQTVAVQITKDAIGDKGPTLTTYISIPGRYLVLMPSLQRTGVSRKIEDEKERRRLKRILEGLAIPEGMGIIVRTAGVGRTKQDIQRDLDYLVAVWEDFSKKLVLGRNPAPLYQESDVAIRTMRDLFSARTETVVVDSPKVFEHMREFTRKLMPEHLDRIVLHEAPKPLFHHYGTEADYERIFARRVELPSGGSIVIDQTEALVAIDVNSGRTRDEGADFEDIALKTNLEAAPEIARQIRLRDLGGILVLDFIDMLRQSSRKLVERTLRDCLATDRARSKVGRISQFGLLELTRQRLGPGLSRLVYDTCPACKGSGRRRTPQSRAQAILRRLSSALTQKGFTKVEVVAHHDTVEWLEKRNRAELEELQERAKREVVLKGVDEQAEESIFHYLRADGREVRPGGRRKR